MKWKDKTIPQKVFSVFSWVCIVAAFAQAIGLLFWDVYVIPQPVCHLLLAVFWVGFAVDRKNRKLSVWFFLFAGLHVLSAILTFWNH